MKRFLLLLAVLVISNPSYSQDQNAPILFIYDGSGSMWGAMENKTKKEIAAEVLTSTVINLPENQNLGLIAYGHREKGNCDDIEYLADLSNQSKSIVTNAVKKINPVGKTPLARSALMAINSLKESNTKATIILITDGIESCDGDICQVIREAKGAGIDFKLHIVGFGLKEGEKEQLKCAAKEGDGNYYDADNAGGLGEVLTEATSETVDKPEGNLTIYATKNGEPVDAWVIPKNPKTSKILTGSRTYRDTASVYVPPGKFIIEIRPLEGTDIPSTNIEIEMVEGQKLHRDISFDGGTLAVSTSNNGEPWDCTVRMYDVATGKIASQTRTYGKTQKMEVPAGNYKISILAMKIEGESNGTEIENIVIKSNEINSLSHDFKSGIAMIGVKTTGGELIDATVNIFDKSTGKNVAAGRTYTSSRNNPKKFILNPGDYEVKIKTLGAHKGNSKTIPLTVKQSESVEKITTF